MLANRYRSRHCTKVRNSSIILVTRGWQGSPSCCPCSSFSSFSQKTCLIIHHNFAQRSSSMPNFFNWLCRLIVLLVALSKVQQANKTNTSSFTRCMYTIICHNSDFSSGNTPIHYPIWHQKGTTLLHHLFDKINS